MARACIDCGASISAKSKGGRCRRCGMIEVNQRPEKIAQVAAHFRARRPSMPVPVGDALARRNAAIRAGHLSWCPEEHWDLNEYLRRRGHKLAERKSLIAEQVRADERREADETNRMTPFERQLERVRQGARLVEKPNTSRRYDFTLGGNATGMI